MTTTPTPETLLAVVAELDRLRALLAELLERSAPRLMPAPPEGHGAERATYELLLSGRRAVLGNPAAARGLYELLVAEGRRHADTPAGAQLRDRLACSEAVDHLRRVWEAVSLNVLDGPAAPSGVPDAWAELLADVVTGHGLNEAVLARLRPEGFA
jgi:hypothetical protein